MFDRWLDVTDLQYYTVPESAVHQAVGTRDSLLSEELKVSFL
jgi:hypothetical protein